MAHMVASTFSDLSEAFGKPGKNYRCDSTADLANLPDASEITIGSTAYIISTGDVYMLSSNGWEVQ